MNKITVHFHKAGGRGYWIVSRFEFGVRTRSHFATKAEAEDAAHWLREQRERAGAIWMNLSPMDRDRLIQAYDLSKRSKVDLVKAIEFFADIPAKMPSLSACISELLNATRQSGCSEDYLTALNGALNQFAAGRETAPITAIRFEDVLTFLESKKLESRPTFRARLSTLFKFCLRRGYIKENPCAQLPKIRVPRKPVHIFTVEQFKRCLEFFRTRQAIERKGRKMTFSYAYAFPWFVLSCCCGLRPEEAEQTRRKDVHLREGWIRVEAQTTKVRQRRVVYPRPEALALLREAMRGGRLPLDSQAKKRVQKRLAAFLGWSVWPKDVTRHTAASYWLAIESSGEVAKQLGNSEKVLLRDYRALVTRADAQEFWSACNCLDFQRQI